MSPLIERTPKQYFPSVLFPVLDGNPPSRRHRLKAGKAAESGVFLPLTSPTFFFVLCSCTSTSTPTLRLQSTNQVQSTKYKCGRWEMSCLRSRGARAAWGRVAPGRSGKGSRLVCSSAESERESYGRMTSERYFCVRRGPRQPSCEKGACRRQNRAVMNLKSM